MSQILQPYPAAIIVGFLAKNDTLIEQAKALLIEELGPEISGVKPFSFNYSSYYQAEMGKELKRSWSHLAKLCHREYLAQLKNLTIEIEKAFSIKGKREINIDPGLLSLENFSLATTKNYAHRIYLGQNIFAEISLIYQNGSYHPLPWSYPDYCHAPFLNFANSVRAGYKSRIDQENYNKELFWPSRA